MKEPDDILKEIRELLGEDIEKIEEKQPQTEEELKIPGGEGIEKLLSEIEEESKEDLEPEEEKGIEDIFEEKPTEFELGEEIKEEPQEPEISKPQEGLEEELEEEIPIAVEENIEQPSFELEKESQEPETPGFEPQEGLEEELEEEIPIAVEENIEQPSFELEKESQEPEYKIQEPETSSPGILEELAEELEEAPISKAESRIEEESKWPEITDLKPQEELETITAESKEQEEMKALLKEDVKKKASPPKEPIKINKNLVFIPILILSIIGIIGAFGFLFFLPNVKLKDSIAKVERGKTKEGREAFDKWIGFVFLKSQKIPFYHQLGEAYLSINEHSSASSIFWEAFKNDPYNQDTQNYILSYTLKMEGLEKAKEQAEKILLKDKKSIPAYLTISKYLKEKGEIKKAISSLENALKASPSNLSAISFLQKLYLQDKQYDKVISLHRFLIDHLKIKPLNPEVVTEAAGHFVKLRKLNIGKPTLEEILSAFPKNTEARYFLSLSFLMEGNKEKAKEELKRTIENEDYGPAYNLFGEILRDEGKYIEALEKFSKACLYSPHFGKAYYNLADTAFYNLNDYSASIKGYEDARKNGYETKQLSYNLGFSYYIKGRYKEAKDEFKKYKEDETILYNIALADCRLKNFSFAKEGFKRAESLYKERIREKVSPKEEKEIYLYLSNIYNNLGLISEISGLEQVAQERYWDAINTAKLSGFEHKNAFSNLTNFFNGKPNSLAGLSDKMDKGYNAK